MNDLPLRVVKVGGSLFDLPDLPDRLTSWLANQSPARNVLIAGGGSMVDALRRLDRHRSIGEATCHWLAIDLMDISARVLGAWMPDAVLARNGRDLETVGPLNRTTILVPGAFLRENESSDFGRDLPQNWQVTSDSIAAHFARVLLAAELVLLKSAPPPDCLGPDTAMSLAERGYVDPCFPGLANEIPAIRYVDFRSSIEARQLGEPDA